MSESATVNAHGDRRTGGAWAKPLKIIAWAIIVFLAAQFWWTDARPFLEWSEAAYGRFWPHSGWLLVHVIGGTLALFAGPFQFWTGLRRSYMNVHRWIGRMYLTGVALSSASAFYLATVTQLGWTFGVALFVLGFVWVLASGMGLIVILRGLTALHKEWMIRSYVITFAFITFRLLLEVEYVRALDTISEVLTTLAWLSWTVPLFVTEVILQVRKHRLLKFPSGSHNERFHLREITPGCETGART